MSPTSRLAIGAFLLASALIPLVPTGSAACVGPEPLPPRCCDSSARVPISTADATFYIDVRTSLDSGAAWIYEETNQVDELQRGGDAVIGVERDVTLYNGPYQTQPLTVGPVLVPGQSVGPLPFPTTVIRVDAMRYDNCYDALPGLLRDTNLI